MGFIGRLLTTRHSSGAGPSSVIRYPAGTLLSCCAIVSLMRPRRYPGSLVFLWLVLGPLEPFVSPL